MKNLKITPASFEEALELQDAVAEALSEKNIEISPSLFEGEVDGSIVKALLSVAKNKRLRAALFVCSERSLYNKEPITQDFFEPVERRALYYPIMIEVLKENLGPFFADLFGSLKEMGLDGILKKESQEQK